MVLEVHTQCHWVVWIFWKLSSEWLYFSYFVLNPAFPFSYHRSSTFQTECRKLSVPGVSSEFASFSPTRPSSDANFELRRKNFSWIILFYANSCNFYLLNCPYSGLNIFIIIRYNRIFLSLLGAFAYSRKRPLPPSCPSVCSSTLPHVSAPIARDGFPWNLILSYKNLSINPKFVWLGKNIRHPEWRSNNLLFFLRC